jgi:hypothetical protein
MEVTHLGVFLNIERIIHISPDTKPQMVNRDHSIPAWPLKDMQLDDVIFAGRHDPEFTEAHLEHHVLSE